MLLSKFSGIVCLPPNNQLERFFFRSFDRWGKKLIDKTATINFCENNNSVCGTRYFLFYVFVPTFNAISQIAENGNESEF